MTSSSVESGRKGLRKREQDPLAANAVYWNASVFSKINLKQMQCLPWVLCEHLRVAKG